MSRQIFFRAKVLRPNPMTAPGSGWVEGFYYQDLCKGEVRHFIKNCPCDWEIDPKSLGQAIGLLDRNGNDVYEGDIMEYKNNIGVVTYYAGRGQFLLKVKWLPPITMHNMKGTIIGNIHDNSELLNPTKL